MIYGAQWCYSGAVPVSTAQSIANAGSDYQVHTVCDAQNNNAGGSVKRVRPSQNYSFQLWAVPIWRPLLQMTFSQVTARVSHFPGCSSRLHSGLLSPYWPPKLRYGIGLWDQIRLSTSSVHPPRSPACCRIQCPGSLSYAKICITVSHQHLMQSNDNSQEIPLSVLTEIASRSGQWLWTAVSVTWSRGGE